MGNSRNIWGILTLIFLGFIGIGVLRNAKGFSLASGTLFTGVNTLGRTLESR
jgi:hypothetical protein